MQKKQWEKEHWEIEVERAVDRKMEQFNREAEERVNARLAKIRARAKKAAKKKQAEQGRPAKQDVNIWITCTGWPNLHPFSLLLAAIAVFACLFVTQSKFAEVIVTCAIWWWLLILPILIVLTGGNVWDPAQTERGDWGRGKQNPFLPKDENREHRAP